MKRDRTDVTLTPRRARAIARALVNWYQQHRRDLPWRRSRDPYAIWVSEVMLQQTQVATVVDYYSRWMDRFPTVSALAKARESDVLLAWQGLGYYSRARNLWRGARTVEAEHAGRLPKTADELRRLPGIGPYSAGAIASIAHGQPAPIVDGNVARVLCRLFVLTGDPSRNPVRRQLWSLAAALVQNAAPSDLNQGLMELGATVCTPREPSCPSCPLRRRCSAHRHGSVQEFPQAKRRPKTVATTTAAAIVRRRGKVLVVRLPDDARRWAGLWQFPTTEVAPREAPEAAARRAVREATGLIVETREAITTVRHSVTHHRIDMTAFDCRAPRGRAAARTGSRVAWIAPARLDEIAMPAAQARVRDVVARLGLSPPR